MKISIDTKEDSHEDIRKVIGMLQRLVGEERVYSNQANIFEDSKPEMPSGTTSEAPSSSGNVFGNMFGDDSETKEEPTQETGTADPVSEEKKEDIPEIIPYDL